MDKNVYSGKNAKGEWGEIINNCHLTYGKVKKAVTLLSDRNLVLFVKAHRSPRSSGTASMVYLLSNFYSNIIKNMNLSTDDLFLEGFSKIVETYFVDGEKGKKDHIAACRNNLKEIIGKVDSETEGNLLRINSVFWKISGIWL